MLDLGIHINCNSYQEIPRLVKDTCSVFQALPLQMISPPPTMKGFLHYPLASNLSNPDHVARNSIFLQGYLDSCERKGYSGLVIHPGTAQEGQSHEEALSTTLSVLNSTFSSVPLIVEVDPGSKKGTRIGSVEACLFLIENGPPNMQFCLDTCHAYVRGVDLNIPSLCTELLEQVRPYLGLVHLNSTGPKSHLGSFLDRHSTTSLEQSTHLLPQSLLRVARFCEENKIPVILERDSGVAIEDIKFLSQSFQLRGEA